jgi:hypothetical protein
VSGPVSRDGEGREIARVDDNSLAELFPEARLAREREVRETRRSSSRREAYSVADVVPASGIIDQTQKYSIKAATRDLLPRIGRLWQRRHC